MEQVHVAARSCRLLCVEMVHLAVVRILIGEVLISKELHLQVFMFAHGSLAKRKLLVSVQHWLPPTVTDQRRLGLTGIGLESE